MNPAIAIVTVIKSSKDVRLGIGLTLIEDDIVVITSISDDGLLANTDLKLEMKLPGHNKQQTVLVCARSNHLPQRSRRSSGDCCIECGMC